MRLVVLCVLAGTLLLCARCERHSLTYIYTALSKEVANPGIHQFTAMGLLDTKMIDYFDSERQQKIPKKDWMTENLSPDYWTKGTESRKSKMQWFHVNLGILKERMNQTDDEVHVLQWMHGCEADLLPDQNAPSGKSLVFQRGIDQYSYDGNSFLYFDDAHEVWVADSTEAEPTKRKWDEVQVLKDYTKGYLEKECLDWLGKFMEFGKAQLQDAAAPNVFMFARASKSKSSVILTCMATGFYPPDIILNIRRNGRLLTKDDGVRTTGIRPNEDDTYQRRDSIEILRSDTAKYICEVFHAATNVRINKTWDKVLPDHDEEVSRVPVGVVVGAVLAPLLVVAGIVGGVLFLKKRQASQRYNGVSTVSSAVKVEACVPLCVTSDSSSSSSSPSSSNESIDKKDPDRNSPDSAIGSGGSTGTNEENTPLNNGEDSGGSNDNVAV